MGDGQTRKAFVALRHRPSSRRDLVGHGADRCAGGSQFSSRGHRVWHKIRHWHSEQPTFSPTALGPLPPSQVNPHVLLIRPNNAHSHASPACSTLSSGQPTRSILANAPVLINSGRELHQPAVSKSWPIVRNVHASCPHPTGEHSAAGFALSKLVKDRLTD